LKLELLTKTRAVDEKKLHSKYKYIKHVGEYYQTPPHPFTGLKGSTMVFLSYQLRNHLLTIDLLCFAEKTKVQRRIRQLEKTEGTTEEQLLEQRVRLTYIEHYPRDMKYISLFPKDDNAGATASGDENTDESSKKRKRAEDEDEGDEEEDDNSEGEEEKGEEQQDDNEKQTKKQKKKKVPTYGGKELTVAETDARRDAILARIKNVMETGEINRSGFVLRMADVFGEEELTRELAKETLTKKHRLKMTKEERLAFEAMAGKVRKPKEESTSKSDSEKNAKKEDVKSKGS
jgi:hypothetical protein